MKHNPMNTKTNKELLLGHSILHGWAKDNWKHLKKRTNWNKTEVRKEHARLVRIMRARGMKHHSPIN